MSMEETIHEQAAQRSATAKALRQVEANDVKWLMSNKQGRRFISRLIGEAGVYRTTFTGNSETFFKEGKRSFGLFLISEVVTHAPESYALMQTEARSTNE